MNVGITGHYATDSNLPRKLIFALSPPFEFHLSSCLEWSEGLLLYLENDALYKDVTFPSHENSASFSKRVNNFKTLHSCVYRHQHPQIHKIVSFMIILQKRRFLQILILSIKYEHPKTILHSKTILNDVAVNTCP